MIAFIPLFGLYDRLVGWGGWGRTKPVIGCSVATIAISLFSHLSLLTAILMCLAFLAWRTPPWGLFGGSINPSPRQSGGTFARHLLSLAFVIPALVAGVPLIVSTVFLVLFSVIATSLGVLNYFQGSKY